MELKPNDIDALKLPTCSLYKCGYTSIGKIDDTKPNKHLYDMVTKSYRHARELENPCLERDGRILTE